MQNLTLEERLVQPALDANPVPDHDLVVFRRVGEGGLRFHSLLGPGGRLSVVDKLRLGSRIAAYAVTRDQNLRHRVVVPNLESADHVRPFALDLSLAFRIADPRIVVEKLESDPLGRVEKEVREVLGRVASRMDWSAIKAPACDFEDQLLSTMVMDVAGGRVASLALLQGFAVELGLEVKGIQVSRQLPAEVGEAERFLMRESEQRIIEEEQQKSALQSDQHQAQREELQAWKTNAIGSIQLVGELSASATKSLSKSLGQIADKVDTVPALRTAVHDLLGMGDEIGMIPTVGGGRRGDDSLRDMKTIPASSGTGLLGAAPAAGLSGLLAQLATLPLEPADRNRLNSCLLRLTSELVLHGDASAATIDECFHDLADQMPRLVQVVQSADQRDLLVRLQDKDWLCAELARG